MPDHRKRIRKRRADLDAAEIDAASSRMTSLVLRSAILARRRAVAFYLAANGEIDCGWLIEQAWLRKIRVFVPVLRKNRLVFAPLYPDTPLSANRFGILEPDYHVRQLIRPAELEVVFTPLVAFDKNGHRLGMGEGYYDRTFAFLRRRQLWRRPLLVGVAYEFQRVRKIRPAPWDVRLHAVATESSLYKFA